MRENIGIARRSSSRSVYRCPRLGQLMLSLFPGRASRRWQMPPRLRLPQIALQVWSERSDLQAEFDLAKTTGRLGLIQWFLFHGLSEIGCELSRDDEAALTPWHEPYPGLPCLGDMPITWLMRAAATHEGIAFGYLRTPEQQRAFLRWYVCRGIASLNWSRLLSDGQVAILMMPEHTDGPPRVLGWLWADDPDLASRFVGPEDPEFRAWLQSHGVARWPLLADPRIALADHGRPPADPSLPFGVNLIGHARGRLGIGEDVRMAAAALTAVGIPYAIHDFAPGGQISAEDDSVVAYLSEHMPYRFTMICMTGMETVRAVNQLGASAFAGRTVIGFWPWELPEWPHMWQGAYRLVDEVWASTRYTHDAYARSAPVPVRTMPMVVRVDGSAGLGRDDFGLPRDRFLFGFAYDGLSYPARKNPTGCIEAFDRAFPSGNENVGLVIKGIRVASDPGWQALVERAQLDKRLFLIDASLERGALLDLYRSFDCFVSLHRAEGFGRNIAEAMALGKPVIVTAHSGNMDFTHFDTAALVPVRLRSVEPGEYPFGIGQVWAEPDIGAAATTMRRIFTDPTWRNMLARIGAKRIADLYAPSTVGRQWKEALQQLADDG